MLPALRPISSPCTQERQRQQLLDPPVLVSGGTHADGVPWYWTVLDHNGKGCNFYFKCTWGFDVLLLSILSNFTLIPRIIAKSNVNKDDTNLLEELLQRLIDCRLMGPFSQITFHHDPKRLALRELPHGSWSNVYLLYCAHCRTHGEECASKSTFFSVANQWRTALRFHKKTQHQICSTCSTLKMRIRNCKDSWISKSSELWFDDN